MNRPCEVTEANKSGSAFCATHQVEWQQGDDSVCPVAHSIEDCARIAEMFTPEDAVTGNRTAGRIADALRTLLVRR